MRIPLHFSRSSTASWWFVQYVPADPHVVLDSRLTKWNLTTDHLAQAHAHQVVRGRAEFSSLHS